MSTLRTDITVGDVVRSIDTIPVSGPQTLTKEALESMTEHRLGVVCVVDGDGTLEGIFTDGDLRRMLLRDQKPLAAIFADDVENHMARKPTTVSPDTTLVDAVALMEDREVWDLPVVDGGNKLVGLLHLHPAVKALLDI